MDHRELKKLVQLMNDNELVELEIEQEGMRVCLRKAGAHAAIAMPGPYASAPLAPPAAGTESAAAGESAGPPPGTKDICSPMVGTFYRRPSPDSDPYVDVGDAVEPESVVCIVEAMKVNNEIKAEMMGDVVEILAEDGQPVEFDQPLFRVKVG